MKEETLFELALGTPPAELPALLDRECAGDLFLRQRIEKLLAAHSASSDTLVSPTDKAALGPDDIGNTFSLPPISRDASIGTVLDGKFKLIESIGEGGMGNVYMAQQLEPVKRVVAVKVIKAGMDSKAVLARFEAERQALAIMDHPNIAKVLDAGATESGSPYFVMELVKGIPITQYCDEGKLTPKQRLELFLPVCEAIQHSHQKGIIHRDIKPSNVLVAMYDDRPVPKVIDFGVAKATGQSLSDADMITGFGALVGTPEYMSPEQASLNNLDIDTRSDVYSLGVLLFELLSGHTPVDRKSLEKAAILEILRIVRDVDAPLLSAKLSSIDTLPNVAANRRTEPKRLATQFRGELDWVLHKALEKDRTRRYSTANGLARDIQRYLSNEIVEARPPSTLYRLQKFVRRNKGQVLAASLVLIALLAGIAGTTWGLIRAEERRVEAETAQAEEAKQRGIAESNEAKAIAAREEETKQREIAEAEKVRAIQFRDKALRTLRAMTGEDVEKLIGEKTQLTDNEKAYLEAIAKRWQAFATQEGTDQQSRTISVEGHYRVARLWDKLGRSEKALLICEQGVAIGEKLTADFPSNCTIREDLADAHNLLGHILSDLGRLTESMLQYRKALAIQEKLSTDFPAEPKYRKDLAFSQNNLGLLYMSQGKMSESEEIFRQGMINKEKLASDFPDKPEYRDQLATHCNNFALLLEKQGKLGEAGELCGRGMMIRKALVADYPTKREYLMDLASSLNTYGRFLRALGRSEEALEQSRESLAIVKKLTAEYPTIARYSKQLSISYNGLALSLKKTGKEAEAEEPYRNILAISEKLIANYPTVPEYRHDLAVGHNNLGVLLNGLGRKADAQFHYRKGIEIREKLAFDFPAIPEYRQQLGTSYFNMGNSLLQKKNYIEAEPYLRKGIALLEKLVAESPESPSYRQNLSSCYQALASLHDGLRNYTQAAAEWDKAIELSVKAKVPDLQASRAWSLVNSGQVNDGLALIAELKLFPPSDADLWYNCASVYSIASDKAVEKKQEYADQAMQLLGKAVQAGYNKLKRIKKDTDLNPIRDRDDFVKLMSELEAKETKSDPAPETKD